MNRLREFLLLPLILLLMVLWAAFTFFGEAIGRAGNKVALFARGERESQWPSDI